MDAGTDGIDGHAHYVGNFLIRVVLDGPQPHDELIFFRKAGFDEFLYILHHLLCRRIEGLAGKLAGQTQVVGLRLGFAPAEMVDQLAVEYGEQECNT